MHDVALTQLSRWPALVYMLSSSTVCDYLFKTFCHWTLSYCRYQAANTTCRALSKVLVSQKAARALFTKPSVQGADSETAGAVDARVVRVSQTCQKGLLSGRGFNLKPSMR